MFRVVLCSVFATALTAAAFAAPGELPHSGRLLAASGDALEGSAELEFRLYTQATGGSPVWTETEQVQLAGGYYNTLLGDENTLSQLDWSGSSYWLGIVVNGVEMGPRTVMGSVPTAMSLSGPLRAMSMTSGERDALSALPGEVIFNTDLGSLQVFDGSGWGAVGSDAPTGDGEAKGIGWGLNAVGGLGMGDNGQRNFPVSMSTLPSDLIEISSGGYFHGMDGATCAITAGQDLWCSGYESMVPDGSASNVNTFRQVGPGLTWRSVDVGTGLVSCGVTTTNDAYCWGYQLYGGLGNGVSVGSYIRTVTPVIGNIDWKELKPGGRYNNAHRAYLCGVSTATGTANGYCWGLDSYGELGNGAGGNNYTDPAAGLLSGYEWQTIEPGSYHVCGIDVNQDMYCWGYNGWGQIGIGNTTNQQSPVMVSGGHKWVDLAVGDNSTCGIRTDGSAMCWGYNNHGELGDGTFSARNVPTEVVGAKRFTEVSLGDYHACALETTGQAYCWGYGGNGALGNGGTTNIPAPTLIFGDHVFDHIDAGVRESVGITR